MLHLLVDAGYELYQLLNNNGDRLKRMDIPKIQRSIELAVVPRRQRRTTTTTTTRDDAGDDDHPIDDGNDVNDDVRYFASNGCNMWWKRKEKKQE
jgi:hypothetical protein